MKRKEAKGMLALALACLMLVATALPSFAASTMPKNVILMISDGQGYNTVEATRFYTGNPAVYENFPVQMGCSTFSAGKEFNDPKTLDPNPDNYQFHEGEGGYDPAKAWSDFNYVKKGYTDSASAATALATGVKTYDAALNMDVFRHELTNIVQIADDAGKATGVLSSVQLSHATPAGMVAHNVSRNNYAQIAVEMYGSALDVIMATGNPDFDDNGKSFTAPPDDLTTPKINEFEDYYKFVGGSEAWQQLQDPNDGNFDEWLLIQDESLFEALADGSLKLKKNQKLLGVPEVHETLQYNRGELISDTNHDGVINDYDGRGQMDVAPGTDPFIKGVPTLKVMTQGALNLLSKDKDGFFLMVEGGAIDWANHANHMTRMLEEQLDYNASVQAVVDWVNDPKTAATWNDTLLICTADHECGDLWGRNSQEEKKFNPLEDNGAGELPGYQFCSSNHTNALVPVYAKGKGSMNLNYFADQKDTVRGKYIDNTEIFRTMVGDTPWKTYEYSYTYLYNNQYMTDYMANQEGFSGCEYYTGTMYAPLSEGYFVGQVIEKGKNETGKNGCYIVTDMNYKAQSMGKTGRVYVKDYFNFEDNKKYTPMKGNSPKGYGFLGSEKGYLIKNWEPLYLFGQAWYEAYKL